MVYLNPENVSVGCKCCSTPLRGDNSASQIPQLDLRAISRREKEGNMNGRVEKGKEGKRRKGREKTLPKYISAFGLDPRMTHNPIL